MKALRYLLMVVAMVSVLSVSAQSTAQLPQVQMQSTSVMMSSGSTLPQAATTGAYVTGSTVGSYSPARMQSGRPGSIRRGASDEDEGDTPPSDPQGPNENPIGDAVWPLLALAGAYALLRVYRRKRVILIRKRAGDDK